MAGQKLRAGGAKDRGQVREVNEDDLFYVTPESGIDPAALEKHGYLFIVADGVGGNRGGQQASHLAVTRIPQYFYTAENGDPLMNMRMALDGAARDIINEGSRNPDLANMACTVVAAAVHNGKITLGHLGDARVYLMRNGRLQALTKDHTWVQEQVDAGTLTPEEARNHPNRNVITKSLGNAMMPAPTLNQVDYREGDRLMLCSDGLCGVATDQEMATVLGRNSKMETAAQDLVNLANSKGGPDNIAVVTAQLGGSTGVIAGARPAGKSRAPLLLAILVLAFLGIGAVSYMNNNMNNNSSGTATPTQQVPAGDPQTTDESDQSVVTSPENSETVLLPTSTLAVTGTVTTTESITGTVGVESTIADQDLIPTPTRHPSLDPVVYPEARVIGNPAYYNGPGTDFIPINHFGDSELVKVIASDDNALWYLVQGLAGTPVWLPVDSVSWSNPGSPPEIPPAETVPAPRPTVAKPETAYPADTPIPETTRLTIELVQPLCEQHGPYPENGEIEFIWRVTPGSATDLNLGVMVTPGDKILAIPSNIDSDNWQIKRYVGEFDIGSDTYTWQVVHLDDNGKPKNYFGQNGCIKVLRRGGGGENPAAPSLD